MFMPGFDFYEVKKNVFRKENGNTSTLLMIILNSKKSSKREK